MVRQCLTGLVSEVVNSLLKELASSESDERLTLSVLAQLLISVLAPPTRPFGSCAGSISALSSDA